MFRILDDTDSPVLRVMDTCTGTCTVKILNFWIDHPLLCAYHLGWTQQKTH